MDSVITAIYQCKQREGRSLSVVDLIEKDLLTLTKAAWLVSRVEEGSSWLVGAIPSHAGKTTLMSALLVFLPAQEQVTVADADQAWKSCMHNGCVIAEEISDHGHGQYLWGDNIRQFTSIPACGGRIASTIHATTLKQVREQVARQGVAAEDAADKDAVAAFGMFIPIEVEYMPDAPEHSSIFPGSQERGRHRRPILSRTVELIHYHDGGEWHTIDREVRLTRKQEAVSGFLRSCLDAEIRSCEVLRQAWLAYGSKGSP